MSTFETSRAPTAGNLPPTPRSDELVSVLILTKDEERNIAECLTSLAGLSDDIVVLDSLSTDRTVEIAERFPHVRIVKRRFDTEWRHRNFGLHEIEYKHPWVYICDADERIPAELTREILRVVNDRSRAEVVYRLRYKNMYMGKWIKHATSYPVWIMRLVQPNRVSYEMRETNVHPIVDGKVGELKEHFIHYSFNSGLKKWFDKHNFYSTREAMEGVKARKLPWPPPHTLLKGDPMQRRRALKNLSYRISGRALLRFVYCYLLGGGWLDGRAGLHYCVMISMYEYWIELKIQESESPWRKKTDKVTTVLSAPDETSGKWVMKADYLSPIDVLIPTLNEADHITEAVEGARTLGRVFVLDSFSTDGTQELARAAGATVIEHRFENYARQKNWGLENLPFQGEWLFILDADERITPPLRNEILRRLSEGTRVAGFYVNRLLVCMGRAVRNGGLYPSWNLRLFRRGKARYEDRSVHEHVICEGRTEYLHHPMLHVRRESIDRFLHKHIKYADMETDVWVEWHRGESTHASSGQLFSDALRLRQWVRRNVWPRLPARPVWRFLYQYFFRFGFLDGTPGWHLAELMACYEYMISRLFAEKMKKIADDRRTGTEREPAGAPT